MQRSPIAKDDLLEIERTFPKLAVGTYKGSPAIVGTIDVSDLAGNFLEDFEVAILIPRAYPFGVPALWEISEKLPREAEDHVNSEGLCCVDMDTDLIVLSRRGIRIAEFIREKVYPFLMGVLYKQAKGEYAAGEYLHGTEGRLQRYKEKLVAMDNLVVLKDLELYVAGVYPGRNEKCWCQSGKKFKSCHLPAWEWLKSVGQRKLEEDLAEIREYLVPVGARVPREPQIPQPRVAWPDL